MSFGVDLWNGFEIIKNQTRAISNKLKTFYKLLSQLKSLEIDYISKFDLIMRDYRENFKIEYKIDEAFKKVLESLDFEISSKTAYINFLTQVSNDCPNNIAFLENIRSKLTSCLNENVDNSSIYDKAIKTIMDKQVSFHKSCKELAVGVAQMELDEMHNKTSKINIDKYMDKLKQTKEEYTNSLNDGNKEREIYNQKSEKLLDELEVNYKNLLEKFSKDITYFSNIRSDLFEKFTTNEKTNNENTYSKVESSKDIFDLIINNATKEFPMLKIELCPVKLSVLVAYIKQKIKVKDEETDRISKKVNESFEKYNIFKDELFFSRTKRTSTFFSLFGKKGEDNNDIMKVFKETEKNKKFMENFADSIFKEYRPDYDEDSNISEQKLIEDLILGSQDCIKFIKHPDNGVMYIEALLKRLTYTRSKGTLELKIGGYGVILSLFDMILQANPKNNYIIKNIMILCQTFYKIEENRKIYLVDGLKNRGIFNSTETWHRAINYSLNFSSREKDLTNIKKN